jgi:hypothetical protein
VDIDRACETLDPESHLLLRQLSDAGLTKRGFSRWTVQHAIDETGYRRSELLELLKGLDSLHHTLTENGVIRVHTRCNCVSSDLSRAYARKAGLVQGDDEIANSEPVHQGVDETSKNLPSYARVRLEGFRSPSSTFFESTSSTSTNRARTSTRTSPTRENSENPKAAENASLENSNSAPLEIANRITGERRIRKKSSDSKNVHQLAIFFAQNLQSLKYRERLVWVGGVPVSTLRKHFSGWLRSGVTPEEIEQMIQAFTATPRLLNPERSAWRSFVLHRETLLQQIRSGVDITEDDWLESTPGEQDSGDWMENC